MTILRVQKKPVEVQAMLFDGTPESGHACATWVSQAVDRRAWVSLDGGLYRVRIETLEGTMDATPGDYIIRGVKGEFYPCKPEIFARTYNILEADR